MTADNKIRVNEPPTGVAPGVLEGVWQGGAELPTMNSGELFGYFVSRGLRTITSVPVSSVITVATIALCVFLLGGVLFGIRNLDDFITDVGTSRDVTVYLKDEAALADIEQFARGLKANKQIDSTAYLSKDAALEIFRQELGSRSSFLSDLEGDNPLPASIEIRLKANGISQEITNDLLGYLRSHAVVSDVVFGSLWVDKAHGVLRLFRLLGTGVLCVVISVLVFLITNTIKLVIYARQDELEIMQLVGASDNFVNIPFVLGGALQGLLGSVFGILLLNAGLALLNQQVKNSSLLGVAIPQFSFLPLLLVFAIVLFGIAIGALGSYFAIRKFLTV